MKFFAYFLFLIAFAGCASYQSKVAPARSYIKSKDCLKALEALEKLSAPAGVDQLALLMEYGTALQICEEYTKSTQVFSQAERLADSVDYISVSEVASATLTNEGMLTYKGDTFEKLFLNASKALNFIQEKNSDSALVEVRRMNQKFSKYKNEQRKDYELNSFSKYLSGLIWESTGQYDDACIDYKDAFFTAEHFREVGRQMLATCWQARRVDEFNSLAKKMNATADEIKEAKGSKLNSELIVLHLQGWGPRKVENPNSPTFPMLTNVPSQTQFLNVEVYDQSSALIGSYNSSSIYSVAAASISSLNADQASLIARRLGARITKHVVADQIYQKDKALGTAALIFMLASERADLRQWSFLPNTIQVIRLPLKPGNYKLKMSGLDFNKSPSESFKDVEISVSKRQKVIHMVRSVL